MKAVKRLRKFPEIIESDQAYEEEESFKFKPVVQKLKNEVNLTKNSESLEEEEIPASKKEKQFHLE